MKSGIVKRSADGYARGQCMLLPSKILIYKPAFDALIKLSVSAYSRTSGGFSAVLGVSAMHAPTPWDYMLVLPLCLPRIQP